MKLLPRVSEEEVANHGRTQQQCHLQTLVVLNLDAVQVRLHDGHLSQSGKQSDCDVGLLALLRLLACQVRRLASHVAGQVLAHPAFLPPCKVDSWRVHVGAGIDLRAVEV